jgi:hypothetical protein
LIAIKAASWVAAQAHPQAGSTRPGSWSLDILARARAILSGLTACLGLALCALALGSCAPVKKSPCAGLVYSEAGLTREQYAPCAKAMVVQLDHMHEALAVLGDAAQSTPARGKARQACFAASSALARLTAEAGGPEKLISMRWDDATLSRFNYDVSAARNVYLVYCYYGLTRPEVAQIDSNHASARAYAATLP